MKKDEILLSMIGIVFLVFLTGQLFYMTQSSTPENPINCKPMYPMPHPECIIKEAR